MVRNVRMNWHLVASKVVIDEKAVSLIDEMFFGEGSTYTHDHGANDLASRRFWVQNASSAAYSEHSSNAGFTGGDVDRDFRIVCSERHLLVLSALLAKFDYIFGNQPARPAACASGTLRLPDRTCSSENAVSEALKPSFCDTASRSFMHAA